eukprot:5746347-Karenia_brevis.AAC.1
MGNNHMAKNFKEKESPPPTVIKKLWVEVARDKWGEKLGTVDPITISTVKDYQDTHLNKYWQIIGGVSPQR